MDIFYHRNIDLLLIILFLFQIALPKEKVYNSSTSNSVEDSFDFRLGGDRLYGCHTNTRKNGEEGETVGRKYIWLKTENRVRPF